MYSRLLGKVMMTAEPRCKVETKNGMGYRARQMEEQVVEKGR